MKKEQKLLEEMASIETMFRGSISKRRQGKSGGEYLAVQCWRNGRNECRYVPPARREAYERAVAGHARIKVADGRTLRFAKTRRK